MPDQNWVLRCWSAMLLASPPLVGAGLAFLPVLGLSLLGLVVDDRRITGSPAWLKPTKFAVSSVIYCFSIAAVFAALPSPTGLMKVAGWAIAVVLVAEVGIIDLQAARGTTSHFNFSSPVNAALFAVMGVGILTLFGASVAISGELFRVTIPDPVWGWTVRLAMLISVVGSATGALMLPPTSAQQADAATIGTEALRGAHTVGALDGGAGLPLLNWSRDHGDLRVPHFVGLHALQIIPLLVWLTIRSFDLRSEPSQLGMVALITASYLALIGLLTAQALAGRSVVGGDRISLRDLTLWGGLTLAGGLAVVTCDQVGRSTSLPQSGAGR